MALTNRCRAMLFPVLLFLGVIVGCGGPSSTPVTPLPDVSYDLEVRDVDTNQVIANAQVTVEIKEPSSIQSGETNPEGKATISIDPMGVNKLLMLVVRADGYAEYCQHHSLDDLPQIIYLERAKSSSPSSPSLEEETATPEPVTPESPPPSSEGETGVSEPTLVPTPQPALPTNTSPPPPPSPTKTPLSLPEPLMIRDLWPTGAGCGAGFWYADIWVQPVGGNGIYKYYVDGNLVAGPTAEGMTIHLTRDDCVALVGTMTVESGNQVQSQGFFVPVPDCCN